MLVQELMSVNVASCSPGATLNEVARLMVKHDCGEIPIISDQTGAIVGVVTDRDIACRAVAFDMNTNETAAQEIMTSPVSTVTPTTSVEECVRLMESEQIRRVPVVNESGRCCGMVSMADIAFTCRESEVGELVREVSEPAPH